GIAPASRGSGPRALRLSYGHRANGGTRTHECSRQSHVGTIARPARAAGGRGAAVETPTGVASSSGPPERAPGRRRHDPTAAHTHRPLSMSAPLPPSPPKALRPAWHIAQAGRLDHPLGRGRAITVASALRACAT